MNRSWPKSQLRELCTRISDGLHGTPEYRDNTGIYFINGNNLKNGKIEITKDTKTVTESELEKNFILLDNNSLLLSINGTLGSMAFFNNERVMLGKSAAYLNFKTDINRFIYYYFQLTGVQEHFYNVATGSIIKNLSLKSIQEFEVPVPKGHVRRGIVNVLSSLDSKIELNNQINQELEAMAKMLYDYWFVQFDFPNEEGKPYKSSGGKMVYNEELKREIPEGWEVKTISEWIEKDKSGDWGKESEQGNYTEKVFCIRGADINGLNGSGEVKAPERYILEKNKHKLLENGDLIIEISGGSPTQSTGRMAFITQETLERFDDPLICSNFCKAVTLKDETYLYNFVYQWNRLYDAGVLFGWEGKTSGIKNFLFESFVTNHQEVFPKKEIVEKFYGIMKPIHIQKQKNLIENQYLAELRDWLLPMLMNGQVTVKSVEVAEEELGEELGVVAEERVEY